jgi:hypothetical protein
VAEALGGSELGLVAWAEAGTEAGPRLEPREPVPVCGWDVAGRVVAPALRTAAGEGLRWPLGYKIASSPDDLDYGEMKDRRRLVARSQCSHICPCIPVLLRVTVYEFLSIANVEVTDNQVLRNPTAQITFTERYTI